MKIRLYAGPNRWPPRPEKPTKTLIGVWLRGVGRCELVFQDTKNTPLTGQELERLQTALLGIGDVMPIGQGGTAGFLVSSHYIKGHRDYWSFIETAVQAVKKNMNADITHPANG